MVSLSLSVCLTVCRGFHPTIDLVFGSSHLIPERDTLMSRKISNLSSFCKSNNITSTDLLKRFPSKADLLKRLIQDRLSPTDIHYITTSLGSAMNKDSRSTLEFGKELMTSWLWEEAVAIKLGLHTNPDACDSGRELLRSGINSQPDMLTTDGKAVEIVVDHTGFITKSGHLDLRGKKLQALIKANAMIVVAFPDGTTIMLDPSKCKVEHLPMHPVWNKPASRITIWDAKAKDLVCWM